MSLMRFQMRKRTRYSLLLMLALMVALVVVLVLRKAAPPEAARLLPESDAIVYANLKPLRAGDPLRPHAGDAQSGLSSTLSTPPASCRSATLTSSPLRCTAWTTPMGRTGLSATPRCLKGASMANASHAILRRSPPRRRPTQATTSSPSRSAMAKETRPLRIAQLGYDTIAASNMPTPEQIHSILDRHRAAASPFAGSSLLSARYSDVPAFSSAWAIGHIGLPFSDRGYISILGLQLPLAGGHDLCREPALSRHDPSAHRADRSDRRRCGPRDRDVEFTAGACEVSAADTGADASRRLPPMQRFASCWSRRRSSSTRTGPC